MMMQMGFRAQRGKGNDHLGVSRDANNLVLSLNFARQKNSIIAQGKIRNVRISAQFGDFTNRAVA
jgi:hypothetical protein